MSLAKYVFDGRLKNDESTYKAPAGKAMAMEAYSLVPESPQVITTHSTNTTSIIITSGTEKLGLRIITAEYLRLYYIEIKHATTYNDYRPFKSARKSGYFLIATYSATDNTVDIASVA